MPKLTLAILTISFILPISAWVGPATANPNQVRTGKTSKVSIALTGKRCGAVRVYSRSRYRR